MKVLHEIRAKATGKTKVIELTYKSAIVAHCLECVGWMPLEVEQCSSPLCPLFPFRNAKAVRGLSGRKANPNALKALKKARQAKKKEK